MVMFSKYFQIAVVNQSSVVTDIDGSNMVFALNMLLPKFCDDWSINPFNVVYLPKGETILPKEVYYMYLMDTSDVETAVAYHHLIDDIPYGKVFANTILSNGGVSSIR
jgi:hypothetical protein